MLKRILLGIFRSFEQTSEKAVDPALRTKHYKLARSKAWEETISVIKKMKGYKLLHEAPSVGELVIEKKTITGRVQDITITILEMGPNSTTIDVYSASRGSLGDLGSNYRVIVEIYNELNRKLSPYLTK